MKLLQFKCEKQHWIGGRGRQIAWKNVSINVNIGIRWPWSNIGADLFELDWDNYLLLVDYNSNFFEVVKLSCKYKDTKYYQALHNQLC
jgi:hypothetical protein